MEKAYPEKLKNVGTKIYELRTSKGLTQEVLAALAGIDSRTIIRIENGSYNMGLNIFFAIAEALDIDPKLLLGE